MKKTSLFLIEMLISIFVFSIASAVCIQLFVKSHLLSQESIDLQQATLQAQNLAESFYADPPTDIATKEVYYYNTDWQPVESKSESVYTAEIYSQPDLSINSDMSYATIKISKVTSSGNDEIYSLSLEKYTGGNHNE